MWELWDTIEEMLIKHRSSQQLARDYDARMKLYHDGYQLRTMKRITWKNNRYITWWLAMGKTIRVYMFNSLNLHKVFLRSYYCYQHSTGKANEAQTSYTAHQGKT